MHSNLISRLKLFSRENPVFSREVRILVMQLQHARNSDRERILYAFLKSHKTICVPLNHFLSNDRNTRFLVFDKDSEPLQAKLRQASGNDHLKSWIATINSVPEYTDPLPDVTKDFITNARTKWDEAVCGNEDVFKCLLRHAVECGKTGKTSPVLINGPPGIGKTLISKVYASILQLPYSFISGPGASVHRGLSGDPALYTNAGPGAIVQAMITTKTGNPSICVDEIDKAMGGHSGRPNFQHEFLAALDESNTAFFDNYLEAEVDASHIPYIFTSNDKDTIAAPLLDRMEIIEMNSPEKETMVTILQKHTLPKVLQTYDTNDILIEENTMEILVDQLWLCGIRSCRPYKKAVDLLISEAYLTLLQTDRPVTISANDAQNAAKQFQQEHLCKTIGFRTA